jgi:hypothetical protein
VSASVVADALTAVPTGIAALLAIGAWLGLGGVAEPGVLTTIPAVALVAGVIHARRNPAMVRGAADVSHDVWDAPVAIALIVAVAVAAVRYWSTESLNRDDTVAYLPLAHLFSQAGGFTPQPFSERRMLSLAAELPMRAEALKWFGIPGARGLDIGVGLGGMQLYLLGCGLQRRVEGKRDGVLWTTLAMMIVCSAVVMLPKVQTNLSPQFLQSLLLAPLVVGLAAARTSAPVNRRTVAAALCGSMALGLRISLAPLLAVLVAIWFIRSRHSEHSDVIRQAGLAIGVALAALLPLMIAAYFSSGTLLFPLTGRGFHASAFGFTTLAGEASPMALRWQAAIDAIPRHPVFWVVAATACVPRHERSFGRREVLWCAGLVAAGALWLWALEQTGGMLIGEERIRAVSGFAEPFASALVYVLGAGAFIAACAAGARSHRMLVVGVGAWMSAVGFATAGTEAFRYTFPAAILLAAALWFSLGDQAQPLPRRMSALVRAGVAAFALAVVFAGGRVPPRGVGAAPEWPFVQAMLRDSVPTLGDGKLLSFYERSDLVAIEGGGRVLINDQPGLAGPELALRALRGEKPLACLGLVGVQSVLFVDAVFEGRVPPSAFGSWVDSLSAASLRTSLVLRASAARAPRVWRRGAVVILPVGDPRSCGSP